MATQAAETTEGPNARRIVGAVALNGHTYVAGEEDALAAALPASDITRLVAANVLAGDWSTPPESLTRTDGQAIESPPVAGDAPPADETHVPPAEKIVPPAPERAPAKKKAAKKAAAKSTPKRGS